MRIGIDVRSIYKNLDGHGRYGICLLKNLALLDDENEYLIFKQKNYEIPIVKKRNFREINVEYMRYGIPEHLYFGRILERENLDIFHSLHFTLPLGFSGKTVVTIHDLMAVVFPQFFSRYYFPLKYLLRMYLWILISLSAKKADKIIAVSEYTKKDILKILNVQKDKVVVISEGVDDSFQVKKHVHSSEVLKGKYGIARKFIFCLGNFKPYKNIPLLLKSFSQLKECHFLDHKLVLGGSGKEIFLKKIVKLIDQLQISDEVILTGGLEMDEIPLFYRAADCFVFPSLYEGFGLPPLEAMACGTPVIVSNSSSLPEVVGDGGILVNPYSEDELTQALLKVLSDRQLREDLSQRGLKRAKLFSWEKTAKETLEIYRSLDQC